MKYFIRFTDEAGLKIKSYRLDWLHLSRILGIFFKSENKMSLENMEE